MKSATALWRIVRGLRLVVAAIVIFVEEWGWRPLTACAATLARWLHLQRLEARIARVTPVVAVPRALRRLWVARVRRALR